MPRACWLTSAWLTSNVRDDTLLWNDTFDEFCGLKTTPLDQESDRDDSTRSYCAPISRMATMTEKVIRSWAVKEGSLEQAGARFWPRLPP